jgi:cellulose synthase/poly-beta-1,6-N-acetylglucosamine synthase-like glycosyltransferase
MNNNKSKYSLNCNASGTGFYITGKVINTLKTYPFNSLTEDYELSLYACVNSLTTYYNDKAVFYDEQPTTFKQYFVQRTRWVKGYFESRKKYRKQLIKSFRIGNKNISSVYESIIGVYDVLFIVIGVILLFINFIISKNNFIFYCLLLLLIVYCLLALFTIFLLHKEKRYKIEPVLKFKTTLMHPFLLFTYVLCLLKVIFVRNIKWDKIEHNHNT